MNAKEALEIARKKQVTLDEELVSITFPEILEAIKAACERGDDCVTFRFGRWLVDRQIRILYEKLHKLGYKAWPDMKGVGSEYIQISW